MERITRRVPMVKPMAKIKPNTITITATTHEGFIQALAAMERGSRIIYHTGDLAFDRYYNNSYLTATKEKAKDLARFANFIYKLYQEGRILLVRRRVAARAFEYMAVKR